MMLSPRALKKWLKSSKCHYEVSFLRQFSHWNYHINSKLCIPGEWPKALSSKDLNNEHADQASPMSLKNGLFKSIYHLKLYQLKALSPGRMAQSSVSQKMPLGSASPGHEQWMCRGFPCVTNEWSFQEHLASKIIASTQSSVSLRHECEEMRFAQCPW